MEREMSMMSPVKEKETDPKEKLRQEVFEEARELHSYEMKYHNFDHAQKVLKCALDIAKKCKEEGLEVDEDVIYYAALLHDAGYHRNHREIGFNTKEEYSAHLAKEMLSKKGVSEEVIKKVQEAILGTDAFVKADKFPTTVEAKILRASDVAGMAGDFDVFLKDSINLKKEMENASGKLVSWEKWKEDSQSIIGVYLGQDIRLTSHYTDPETGKSAFHSAVEHNLKKLVEMSDEELDRKAAEILA